MSDGAPDRIRNLAAYRAGQPDLDVFKKCFEGYTSPRFCGSDIDAMYWAPHGLWERCGHILVQEHKTAPASWSGSHGQWYALNSLAEIGQELRPIGSTHSLVVLVTYGEANNPDRYHWLPVHAWGRFAARESFDRMKLTACSLSNINSMPHRIWISAISKKRQCEAQGSLA